MSSSVCECTVKGPVHSELTCLPFTPEHHVACRLWWHSVLFSQMLLEFRWMEKSSKKNKNFRFLATTVSQALTMLASGTFCVPVSTSARGGFRSSFKHNSTGRSKKKKKERKCWRLPGGGASCLAFVLILCAQLARLQWILLAINK